MNICARSDGRGGAATKAITLTTARAPRASVLLALAGVPAVYLPGIAGTQLVEQVKLEELDESRSISRQRGDPAAFGEKMTDSSSVAYRIVKRFRDLAERRNSCPAFHPNGAQHVISGNSEVFTLVRRSPDGSRTVLALTNVSAHEQRAQFTSKQLGVTTPVWKDMLGDRTIPSVDGGLELALESYEVLWLEPGSG